MKKETYEKTSTTNSYSTTIENIKFENKIVQDRLKLDQKNRELLRV